MKSSIPKPAIAAILALAAVALILLFVKFGSGGSAPQVDPASLPDYSKMSPEEINAAHNATPGNEPPGGGSARGPSTGSASAGDGHDSGANPQTGRN